MGVQLGEVIVRQRSHHCVSDTFMGIRPIYGRYLVPTPEPFSFWDCEKPVYGQ